MVIEEKWLKIVWVYLMKIIDNGGKNATKLSGFIGCNLFVKAAKTGSKSIKFNGW